MAIGAGIRRTRSQPNQSSTIPDLFDYVPHPRIEEHHAADPPKVDDERQLDHPNWATGFNARVGLAITNGVGTTWAAYLFTLLALCSPPAVLSGFSVFTHTFPRLLIKLSIFALIAWIAQTFLQLVLLPIIIVGQNIQAKASDKRAEETFKDAEAVLHEATQIQAHLLVQDKAIDDIVSRLQDLSKA